MQAINRLFGLHKYEEYESMLKNSHAQLAHTYKIQRKKYPWVSDR